MALFYSDKLAKKSPKTTACPVFQIQNLDYQGLGVAKLNGKTWFIENALPNERVRAKVLEEKRQYGHAQAVEILQKSAKRQSPFCPVYSQCGGCQMQHIPLEMQRQTKQNSLFQRLQKLQAEAIDFQPMIVGNSEGYRRRARLSIALQKNQLAIGFRQAGSQDIIHINQCQVLEPELSALLPKIQILLQQWENKKQLGHLELVQADNGIALLLRHIGAIAPRDQQKLRDFAEHHQLMLFVMYEQDLIEQWRGEAPYYEIQGLKLHFSIRDFIQVNRELNPKMVETAINWLDLSGSERVLDLFCGMGNFTLPIAQQAKKVVGVEGVEPMVIQARQNAETSGIKNAEFYRTDLDQPFIDQTWAKESFDKVLLDPARNGALFCLDHLCDLKPSRIVYVSCNPATLVRDAQKLIANGYRIEKSAMIDMFPHTGHLESVTLFVK
ncbi:23S rRNA (uracil-5-)-methyltransferase RumA [Bibersteinia trehalosi USDA-ARS-USMARC-188]|uniref:23S rRNA (uracil(1939)-C(5))-methyltransferase RlmD n=2 Tax=Bibersteinia trehalosi TaxID=47735 RepID=A0A4V7IBU9_BIBTR|nr:23S rRNA (uracil(1939)-C(5))-methyltransferase RlmD [Bibersteinia trehalosi]AHG82504.1 23S rRNA (uracil-5-)-methyltransferase RumA [Bibersteinia trehalosi USDA-ARS-USMARC-188]AHG84838.1 23S rRNA (uracil-5-)-methyltransferase RumA [Bibersteinia trehalosi USDA-ARS-USMARC-189]